MAEQETNPAEYPTVMVCTSSSTGQESPTVAVWQVETDPKVQQGIFSGAWVITPEGIQGFEATDELIEYRDNQQEALATLLAQRTVLAVGNAADILPTDYKGVPLQFMDVAATVQAAKSAQDVTREAMAQAQTRGSTRKAPEWENFILEPIPSELTGDSGPGGAGQETEASQNARTEALSWAHGVKRFAEQWNSYESARKSRKYLTDAGQDIRPLPVVNT